MPPCLARGLAFALVTAVILRTATAQSPGREHRPNAESASLVRAAQEQRVFAATKGDLQPSPTTFASVQFGIKLLEFLLLSQSPDSSSGTGTVTLVTKAPDSVCGFVSASSESPAACGNGGICFWAPDAVSAIICADADKGIPFPGKLQCFPRSAARDSNTCDDVCLENVYNLLCNDQPVNVSFTYNGQNNREFTTCDLVEAELSSAIAEAQTITQTVFQTLSAPSTSETGDDTRKDDGGGTSNVGAIVGGTAGAVAALGLIGLGIFFLLRRRGPKGDNDNVQAEPMPEAKEADAAAPQAQPVEMGGTEAQMRSELPLPGPDDETSNMYKTIGEVGPDNTGHHRGTLHEMGWEVVLRLRGLVD